MAQKLGNVEYDRTHARWFVNFGRVRFPGVKKPRRVRLYTARGLGALKIREMAEALRDAIRGEVAAGKTLQQALARHLGGTAPENAFLLRWVDFVQPKARRRNRRPVSDKRVAELDSYIRRGYFEFFEDLAIQDVTTGTLDNWLDFMDDNFGHLSTRTVHHVLHDIAHFLRRLRAKGDLVSVAFLPALALGQLPPIRIPDEETLAAYLDLIPEIKRGLFLARSYNGLRLSEARALNVQDYDFRQHELTLSHTKTGEPAIVPVDWEVAHGSRSTSTRARRSWATGRCSQTRTRRVRTVAGARRRRGAYT